MSTMPDYEELAARLDVYLAGTMNAKEVRRLVYDLRVVHHQGEVSPELATAIRQALGLITEKV